MKPLYVGADLSLGHSGIVIINSKGKVVNQFYFHTTKKMCRTSFGGTYLQKPLWTKKSSEIFNWELERLVILSKWFNEIYGILRSTYRSNIMLWAIEGYAHGYGAQKQSRATFQTGGFIELLKLKLYEHQVPMRIIDPQTLRAWVHVPRGGGKRYAIDAAVKQASFKLVNDKRIFDVKKQEGPASDLADAYWLADMARVEILVRRGKIQLKDLPQHQRDLFLRVTKTQKVNLLARDFILRQER